MKNSKSFYDKLFKTAMAAAMATSAIAVVTPTVVKANTKSIFGDVKEDADYYEHVNELFERGFVNGYSDGFFKPMGLLTRAEAAKILALNLGLDTTKSFSYSFKDVPRNNWAYPYIAALKEAGIIDGYPDGSIKPGDSITRSQMAKMLVIGYDLQPVTTITFPFTDIPKDSWEAPYIQALYDVGIAKGQTATRYGGSATVNRANMAAFAMRAEITTDYQDNQRADQDVISAIQDNKITINGQEYYIKKELQPLLKQRNLAALQEANLDFIKIGTKIVGIRNIELVNEGTANQPLTLDLAGSTVATNITIAGDYIELVNGEVTGDVTVKNGDQQQVAFENVDINGRLVIEGDAQRQQETVVKLTSTTAEDVVVNRDHTKIVTENATPAIQVGDNVSTIEVAGKSAALDFVGNQNVLVKGTTETESLKIATPIQVTLENKAQLPTAEVGQSGSQLIVPEGSTIDTFVKPKDTKPEEVVKLPDGGTPAIGKVIDKDGEVQPTPPPVTPPVTPPSTGDGSTGGTGNMGGSGNTGGSTTPAFTSQTVIVNNVEDANDKSAIGMVGTVVSSSNETVATAIINNDKITLTSKRSGTATITVKDASDKEAQIVVTVDGTGKISYTINRPTTNPTFVSQTETVNNDETTLGLVGTGVSTSDANVMEATIDNGQIKLTSTGPGDAIITVTDAANQESQIVVTVTADGEITTTIKKPLEVAMDKLGATTDPVEAQTILEKLGLQVGDEPFTADDTKAVVAEIQAVIAEKEDALTQEDLKMATDIALLPKYVKYNNSSLEQVKTQLRLMTSILGGNGTKFAWKSVESVDNAGVATNGAVTRSANDDEDDIVTLAFTATNGAATKEGSLEATIIESKKPELVKAVIIDKNKDGQYISDDEIELTFSEPIESFDGPYQGINSNISIGTSANEGQWNEARTKWTGILTVDNLQPNQNIAINVSHIVDRNSNEQTAKVNQPALAYEYEATLDQTHFTGDFYYTVAPNNTLKLESKATNDLTDLLKPNGPLQIMSTAQTTGDTTTVDTAIAEIKFDRTDLLNGSLESGNYTLETIQVKFTNHQPSKFHIIKLTTPITVQTSKTIKVTSEAELKKAIIENHINRGFVDRVEVADSVTTPINVTGHLQLMRAITLDGNGKLTLSSFYINTYYTGTRKITLTNLDITGHSSYAYGLSINYYHKADITLDHVNVIPTYTGTAGNYSAINITGNYAKLGIKDSTIIAKRDTSGSTVGNQIVHGIYAQHSYANITSNNSTIAGLHVNADPARTRGAYGIRTGTYATLDIKNSTIQATGGNGRNYAKEIYGIYLNINSGLSISANSKIEVVAKEKADAYGIYGYRTTNVNYDGTTFDLTADPDKTKVEYFYKK